MIVFFIPGGSWREHSFHKPYRYLLAFAPSRHRAWVEGMRPIGCSLGVLESLLGGLFEAVSRLLGGPSCGGLLGAVLGPLGVVFGRLGGLLGHLGSFLGSPEGLSGASGRQF